MRILVIPADENQSTYITDLKGDDSAVLAYLQRILGGYVEPVVTPRLLQGGVCLLVDEEGAIKNKPENIRIRREQLYLSALFGDVVIIGHQKNEDGLVEWVDFDWMSKNA